MHYVTDASYAGGYKIKLRFDDNAIRVVDLVEHLEGPIFRPLKELEFFKRFTLNHDIDTVIWPNGADFSPDFLYEIGENIGEQPAGADALTQAAHP